MKVTITYPESWADIKLSQYLRYYKVIKPYVDTEEYDKISLEKKRIDAYKDIAVEYAKNQPKTVTYNNIYWR